MTEVKQSKTAKKSDGSKSKSIRGIPKLVDANFAGTADSDKCTIIFCEGDSAKAGIVSGLSKEDRNIIGVYPMKGKLFNVRGEAIQKISENKEIIFNDLIFTFLLYLIFKIHYQILFFSLKNSLVSCHVD